MCACSVSKVRDGFYKKDRLGSKLPNPSDEELWLHLGGALVSDEEGEKEV